MYRPLIAAVCRPALHSPPGFITSREPSHRHLYFPPSRFNRSKLLLFDLWAFPTGLMHFSSSSSSLANVYNVLSAQRSLMNPHSVSHISSIPSFFAFCLKIVVWFFPVRFLHCPLVCLYWVSVEQPAVMATESFLMPCRATEVSKIPGAERGSSQTLYGVSGLKDDETSGPFLQ